LFLELMSTTTAMVRLHDSHIAQIAAGLQQV
jgi:hypothetical protein